MHYLTMSNLISDGRKGFNDILVVVKKLILDDEEFLIKYRTLGEYKKLGEFKKHPSSGNIETKSGQGRLLDYCAFDTIVIGYPGSAMLECLTNDINFFSFSNYEKHISNPSFNALTTKLLYIAKSKEELLNNIINKKIYKAGYSKSDLLHNDGKYLDEIVSFILNKRNHRAR